jgi:threonine synthase
MSVIACTNCSESYPTSGSPLYRCPKCGGIFDYLYQLSWDKSKVEPNQSGLWRYHHTFNLSPDAPVVTLGEGNTPLVWGEAFGQRIAFKCEFLNPSGSFKDRGSALIVSELYARGVHKVIEDSSGNAGSSLAAYCARAGISARIYMPESASVPKRRQIEAYGAEVIQIKGPRSKSADAVKEEAEKGGHYASHAYLPFNIPGYATITYELQEQLLEPPGTVLLPVGQGGLLLGLGRGFEALLNAGEISHMPKLVGVQARACAPLWSLFEYGPAGLGWSAEGQTLAEGIRIHQPLRGDSVLNMINKYQGMILAVDEEEIKPGQKQLSLRGLYVEPTSAVVWGALAQIIDKTPEPIVVILTGSGFKSEFN